MAENPHCASYPFYGCLACGFAPWREPPFFTESPIAPLTPCTDAGLAASRICVKTTALAEKPYCASYPLYGCLACGFAPWRETPSFAECLITPSRENSLFQEMLSFCAVAHSWL